MLQSARNTRETREQGVAEFEMECAKTVDEDAKIMAPEANHARNDVRRSRACSEEDCST